MRTLLNKIVLIAIFGCNLNAKMLIDASTLNGSFESGEVNPWSVGTDGDTIIAIEDENFAYDGGWYAEIGIDKGRAFVSQYISSVTPSVSDTFAFSFQARKSTPGPNSISAGLSGRTINGDWLGSKRIVSVVPELSNTEWRLYSYTFQFDQLWDPSIDLYLFIGFSDGWDPGSKGFLG